MSEQPKYYDIRSDFWRSIWGQAEAYEPYLDSDPEKAERWRAMAEQLPSLSDAQRSRLTGYDRQVNVLMYSGIWCGDCVRQGPILRQIVDASDEQVTLRVIDRDANPKLRDELRILGAMRVPIMVFLTEDFFEIGRFGDRLLTVYRAKAKRELGAACSTGLIAPPPDELAAEQEEWVSIFERMLLMARLSPPLRARHGD